MIIKNLILTASAAAALAVSAHAKNETLTCPDLSKVYWKREMLTPTPPKTLPLYWYHPDAGMPGKNYPSLLVVVHAPDAKVKSGIWKGNTDYLLSWNAEKDHNGYLPIVASVEFDKHEVIDSAPECTYTIYLDKDKKYSDQYILSFEGKKYKKCSVEEKNNFSCED